MIPKYLLDNEKTVTLSAKRGAKLLVWTQLGCLYRCTS